MNAPDNPPLFNAHSITDVRDNQIGAHLFTHVTLRDWFAGKALAGFCAGETEAEHFTNAESMAMVCYEKADAMLLVRAGCRGCASIASVEISAGDPLPDVGPPLPHDPWCKKNASAD